METVEQMEAQRIPKFLFEYNPVGKRDPGITQKILKYQFLI
jgi:hypothetical protein